MPEQMLYQAHPPMFRNHPLGFVLSVLLIAVAVGIIILLVWYVKSRSEQLTITNEGLRYEKGILSKTHTSSSSRAGDRRFERPADRAPVGRLGLTSGLRAPGSVFASPRSRGHELLSASVVAKPAGTGTKVLRARHRQRTRREQWNGATRRA